MIPLRKLRDLCWWRAAVLYHCISTKDPTPPWAWSCPGCLNAQEHGLGCRKCRVRKECDEFSRASDILYWDTVQPAWRTHEGWLLHSMALSQYAIERFYGWRDD